MNFIKKIIPFVFVIILSLWAVKPFFAPGFFPMHDDTQVARVYEMNKSLSDGMFPVRWVSDLGYGYGYPIFNFYAPLAYYIGGFFNYLGFDSLVSTKIMMVLGILLAGIFMYVLASWLFGKIGGIIAALFYTYAPYHAVDIYVRGDVAEFWAYAFIPLLFYGLLMIYEKSKWGFVVIGAIAYAGIILSHNLTAMMATPFLLIITAVYCYMAYRNKKMPTVYYLLSTIFLGLLLSAFYWVPALLEMHYTNVFSQIGGGADFRDHFVCINQLWQSPWGFGGSTSGCADGLSFKIGKLHMILSFIGITGLIWIWFSSKKKDFFINPKKHNDKIFFTLLSVFGLLISSILTLGISKFTWENISLMAFFQYPWRFLLLVSFFSSILAGFSVWVFEKKIEKSKPNKSFFYMGVSVLIFILFYVNAELFVPQTIVNKTNSDYTNLENLKWTMSKISDEYMPKGFNKPTIQKDIVNEKLVLNPSDAKILYQKQNSQGITAVIDVFNKTNLHINMAYFPAWNAFLNRQKINVTPLKNGMNVILPEGRHNLSIDFMQTPIEKFANAVSLSGLFMLIIGIILSVKIDYERKNF